jgi:hypothetical protein
MGNYNVERRRSSKMEGTSQRSTAAATVKRHRDGIATKLKRIEAEQRETRRLLELLLAAKAQQYEPRQEAS